jgi:hypothetical protein
MVHWTGKRLFLSAVVIFSILGAAGWQWGDVASFTADNEPSMDNHFGLTRVNDSDELIINQVALGPLVWTLVFVVCVLIWSRTNASKYNKFLNCYWIGLPALWFLTGIFDHFIARSLVWVFTLQPIVWSLFTIALFMIYLEYQPPWHKMILLVLGLGLLTGDFFFGWMGHITGQVILATLSFVLHALTMFSYIAWMGILLIPLAVAMGLAVALAIAIALACLAIALICVLVSILLIILIVFMVCGVSPGEFGRDTGKFFLCVAGGDDPNW